MQWPGRRLAQLAFIALAVNRRGNAPGLDAIAPEGFLCLWERARDLSALLERHGVLTLNSRGARTKQIFVAGFSAGAYTAMALLGAITAFSRFQPTGLRPAAIPGPREFPGAHRSRPGFACERCRLSQLLVSHVEGLWG